MNTSTDMEDKIMSVLEYYLSLHEADDVFCLLTDSNKNQQDVINLLDKFKNNEY